jgi:trimeric autotransporter adhesin
VADIGTAGSGPAAFVAGTTGLTYSFLSLASATDDIEFSNNSGASWTYTPVAGVNGADPAVTNVRMRPKGVMAASSTLTFRLRYRVK